MINTTRIFINKYKFLNSQIYKSYVSPCIVDHHFNLSKFCDIHYYRTMEELKNILLFNFYNFVGF